MKIHARVTKEIEITDEQAERLNNYLDGCVEHNEIKDILELFQSDVNSGEYEGTSYIPVAWLIEDMKREDQVEDIEF